MTAESTTVARSPYLMDAPPESNGRVLLATGFHHYCALQFGFSPAEIVDAFEGRGDDDVCERVAFSARLLGSVLARGLVRGWARPFGGGAPILLPPTVWELDDFSVRFSTSAIDPKLPFGRCDPTHWLFVDLDDWNVVLAASVEDVAGRRRAGVATAVAVQPPATTPAGTKGATPDPPRYAADRLIRLPEVSHRTGMSRSTIYRRIHAGRFPAGIGLSGNLTVWREADVEEWVANPT